MLTILKDKMLKHNGQSRTDFSDCENLADIWQTHQ